MTFVVPPSDDVLARFLDEHAPFSPVPSCPGLFAFSAPSLVDVWAAAERVAGTTLPSPFWAFPWAAGIALARVVLAAADVVRGRSVIDVGAGGGVSSIACSIAGATRVVACDVDPWALAVTRLAAARQCRAVETMLADVTMSPEILDDFDVILAGDLAYDRTAAPRERAAFERAAARGATVLLADAGRTYFVDDGLELLAEWEIPVVRDLEGGDMRRTRVFRLLRTPAPRS
jgi:predicted nicotinamide N-methyase